MTIRDLPDDVVAGLKARAKRRGRSMEAEVREILTMLVMDRRLLQDLIDRDAEGNPRVLRPVAAGEIDGWLESTRRRR